MFVPENEQGVVFLFGLLIANSKFSLIEIGTKFPDAILVRDGVNYRTEFEYLASNFIQHSHDPRRCDLIICWQNDLDDCLLPIIELSNPAWPETDLSLPTAQERELVYWKYRALKAEGRHWRNRAVFADGDGIVVTEEIAGRIAEMARSGASNVAIEEAIFGYRGGAAYHKVRKVLGVEAL